MTGFARAQGERNGAAWSWEAKSVNSKGLDIRCRVPAGFESVEIQARERSTKRFKRGNVSLGLTLTRATGAGVRVNREILAQIIALLPEIARQVPSAEPPRLDGILGIRGVIEPLPEAEAESEDERRATEGAVLASLDVALEQLATGRAQEGARLHEVLDGHVAEMVRLCAAAETFAAMQPEAIRERLRTQVRDLLGAAPSLSEDRLLQEVALLWTKADIREELDRLKAHLAATKELLHEGVAVGRRLDFLCQELNREANTLCSKSADVELTRVGLGLKAAIEQFREQVQNVE
ncbi:MAG: YicC family protein [Rhodospirillales bacterium]|nr:YicC family protein [Rhodospirillales bacterium]